LLQPTSSDDGARKAKPKPADVAKRHASFTVGLTVAKVAQVDEHELDIEFEDWTRLFARSGQRLDASAM
jgi:hypothetical protein